MNLSENFDVAVLGGTGKLGTGLGARLAVSGMSVFLGSRREETGVTSALRLKAKLSGFDTAADVAGGSNHEAALRARVVIVAVPAFALGDMLPALAVSLADKVVVSTAVPVRFAGGVATLEQRSHSMAEDVARMLPHSHVAGAFHTVSNVNLGHVELPLSEDILITSDSGRAFSETAAIVDLIDNARPVNAGALANSGLTESLAVLLISINATYHSHSGIVISGIP